MSNSAFRSYVDSASNSHDSSDEERLRIQMQRLAAAQDELLAKTPIRSRETTDGTPEIESLRAENAELRKRLEELESNSSGNSNRAVWAEQQKEYEALLEEKSDVIRGLHQKVQKLMKQAGEVQSVAAEEIPEKKVLLAMKKELEEQRRQFEEDEQAMMSQMQQMEMTMSRERAEMARQRNEMRRMKESLDHEINKAVRDPSLKERLAALQRNQHNANQNNADENPGAVKKKNSTLLRRIFG